MTRWSKRRALEAKSSLLESMRAYASERIETELEALRRKDAEFYVALAEAAQSNAATSASIYDSELGARLLTAMLDFWLERGNAAEVARRAEALLPKRY